MKKKVFKLKKVIITKVIMFILIVPFGEVWGIIFQPLIGGGLELTFIYPIYAGIIILAGLIVG